MFKKGLKWLVKATTKEDATVKVEKRFEGFHVYGWNPETHEIKIIGEFATREIALEKANEVKAKALYPDVVVHDQDGMVLKML